VDALMFFSPRALSHYGCKQNIMLIGEAMTTPNHSLGLPKGFYEKTFEKFIV